MADDARELIGHFVNAPPDPLRLARRLKAAGLKRIALLYDANPSSPQRRSYLTAEPVEESHELDPMAGSLPEGRAAFQDWPRWIGVLPYEAFRKLERPAWSAPEDRTPPHLTTPRWFRYPAVAQIDHTEGRVMVAGEARASAHLAAALRGPDAPIHPAKLQVSAAHPAAKHLSRVREAIELIRAGDLYQVNLARRLDVHLQEGTPLDIFAAMSLAAGGAYSSAIELGADLHVLSTSPELLLDARANGAGGRFTTLTTEPIKGTRPRGEDQQSDQAHRVALDNDPKEQAELAMIIDVERHDLGRIASLGSVRITRTPHVVSHGTVHHRKARLCAEAKAEATRRDVMRSMLPSGSVTGAPKVRAMEVIRSLEAERRGLYTGGIGFMSHAGSLRLAMAIRTMVLSEDQGHYWTGGGIVIQSDPERELDETNWKAAQLQRLVADLGAQVAHEIPS